MKEDIKVGIADYKISRGPNRIMTLGLGSCIGICIYDRFSVANGLGGLAHIMLPDSSQFKNGVKAEKFADLAIPKMVEELQTAGANIRNMAAKIAGGANMFQFPDRSLNMDIGGRNTLAVRAVLQQLRIPLLAEDTGGHSGRTLILDLEDRTVKVVTMGRQIKIL